MAKKRRNKKKKNSEETWSFHPELHEDVALHLEEVGLYFTFLDNLNEEPIRNWDTNIMGRFVCHNHKCSSHGWGSKVIPVTIQMYPLQRYNAVVYHQRCRGCDSLSRPILNDSYGERVAYWLKQWSGLSVERPGQSEGNGKPHEEQLCEGCKAGHCVWVRRRALCMGEKKDPTSLEL